MSHQVTKGIIMTETAHLERVRELLEGSKETLERRGWYSGDLLDEHTGRVCALGSLVPERILQKWRAGVYYSCDVHDVYAVMRDPRQNSVMSDAMLAMWRALPLGHQRRFVNGTPNLEAIWRFNDYLRDGHRHGPVPPELLDVFNRAIKLVVGKIETGEDL